MDQLSAHLDRAWDRVTHGDISAATRSAERCLDIDPDSPDVHYLLGYVYGADGRVDEAVEHHQRAIELDEGFVDPMLALAELYLQPVGDWDAAFRMAQMALDWVTDDEDIADAKLIQFDALLGKEDKEGAAKLLHSIPRGPFENAFLMYGLGRAHYEVGEIDEAEPLLEKAVELDPEHPDALYDLGLCRGARDNRRGQALAFLQSREAEARRIHSTPTELDEFEDRVRGALSRLDDVHARVIAGALFIVVDLPGAEVVAEGVDPRIPVLFDDLPLEGAEPSVGRIFVYRRNVQRVLPPKPEPSMIEDEIALSLNEEIRFQFPDLAGSADTTESGN